MSGPDRTTRLKRKRTSRSFCAHRRRGSAYLLILMVSMIVSMIGLSSVMISRIQMRTTTNTAESAQARVLAVSAVDLALFTMVDAPSWRSIYTNDTWTAEKSLGEGSIAFKFVDESDAMLSSGPAGPVRVYGRGTVGQTVQMSSVLVGLIGPNLLLNADMEDTSDTTNWVGENSTLQYTSTRSHGGSSSIYCRNRSGQTSGPLQDVTTSITQGSTYMAEAWIWSFANGPLDYRLVFRVFSDVGPTVRLDSDTNIPGKQWTKVTGIFVADWTGTATSIQWKLRSVGHVEWFYFDDVQLTELLPSTHPLPGTWRREVN